MSRVQIFCLIILSICTVVMVVSEIVTSIIIHRNNKEMEKLRREMEKR